MRSDYLTDELVERLVAVGIPARVSGTGAIVGNGTGGETFVCIADAGTGAPAAVARALERVRGGSGALVVIGDRIGRHSASLLREAQVSYMDDRVLNIRIAELGLRVLTERPAHEVSRVPGRVHLSGAAGGVALALLHDPDREWKVIDLGSAAGVAVGTAHNVLAALEAAGLVAGSGSGPSRRRVVLDKSALFDRYAREAAKDRTVIGTGYVLDEGPEKTLRRISAGIGSAGEAPTGIGLVFTGVAAAHLLAPHLSGVGRFEAWVTTPHRLDRVLRAASAQDAAAGSNLTLLRGQLRWLWPADTSSLPATPVPVVSPFRMYADLLADPLRGEEQAEYFRRTVIGF